MNKYKKIEEEFDKILEHMQAIFLQKNRQYGNSFFEENKEDLLDAFANLRRKFARIKAVMKNLKEIGEPLDETLLDLANYCVMTMIAGAMMRKKNGR